MSQFPDFAQYNYQIERILGHNRAGGRVTYLATEIKTQQQVVIKQFQFARSQSNWADYEAYQREIQVLQKLNHPSIPRYLKSFETDTGFCLVQEYKKAPSLAQPRYWTLQEIKQIAIAVLEVLVYLQKHTLQIVHRDLKPENILVDRQGKLTVYLVDFGFASFGNKEVAVSSVVKGTLGFMPPEQIYNRKLTTASDLYSLGMTLICLLTGTKSTEIGKLIDESYKIKFKSLLPKVNAQFVYWLGKMTTPSLKQRYTNANFALAELLNTRITLDLPVATRALVSTAPIVLITTIVGIAISELIELLSQVVNITQTENRITVSQFSTTESLKQKLLKTNQCLRCDLSYVDLSEAHLAGADLRGSNLVRANLRGANLAEANLANTNLRGADFGVTNLVGANLNGTNLTNAILFGTNLATASLQQADLSNASLIKANLIGANLIKANLLEANLEDANLTNAKLQWANLTGTNLRYAELTGAFLKHANLTNTKAICRTNLTNKIYFENTKMPDGSVYPSNNHIKYNR